MAYHSRSRDPLLDSNMQAAIEKRGKELLGLALIALGLAVGMLLLSYTPDDPNWMVSTDAPVQNWMGRTGASIAAVVMMVLGWGSLSISAILLVWGLRFAVHWGEERAMSRLIFAPIAVACASVYAATLVPGQAWTAAHDFGLGGLLGYTAIGAFLTLLPIGSALLIKTMSVLMALGMLALGAFVLGFTRAELWRAVRFAFVGLIVTYGWIASALGRGASQAAQSARALHAARAARVADRRAGAADADWIDAPGLAAQTDEMVEFVDDEPAEQRPGLLARMPSLIRRTDPMPEPELIETVSDVDIDAMPGDDRIRAKIADVIRSRRGDVEAPPPADKPLTKGRGRGPDPLIFTPMQPVAPAHSGIHDGLPPEPPVTAQDYRIAEEALTPEMPDLPGIDEVDAGSFVPFDDEPVEAMTPAMAPPVIEPRKVVQNPVRKAPEPSRRARAEAQPALAFDDPGVSFELPPLNLLANPRDIARHHLSDEALEENARMLETVLDDYGVRGEIVSVRPGPVVTMYELEPAPGLKASRVIGLADDIARSMAALSARVSTVPGRSVIGIELPNENREKVVLREILAARDFGDTNMSLPLALGKDIGGDAVVANLAKMPHLLIAGTTGSGKSVAINTMILSLLYKLTPEDCRLIMIDPKMLELSVYDGIPHLLSPVVTDPKKAVVALKWVVGEMEDRYRKMSKMGVRNIEGYNGRVREALAKGETFSRTVQTGFDDETGDPVFETEEITPVKLPYIVVIVDEMADLMMVAGKEIEACIQRLAQMARASGIHLIMATQRPSVDVITGTIKANFPTRISFQVTSKVDSRTILGEMGAEQLLGMGDMLYMAGGAKITRCHGPFVSDEEVEEIVNHLKAFGPPEYIGGVVEGPDDEKAEDIDTVLGLNAGGNTTGEDALYDQAVAVVIKDRKCSTSYIQRKLAIGYNKAARLVEQMEEQGLVTPANHVGKREILVPEQQ
ncbi:MAG: DNA translocase FtsK 4TM domain-containing protein [Pseudomonadota bacterium]